MYYEFTIGTYSYSKRLQSAYILLYRVINLCTEFDFTKFNKTFPEVSYDLELFCQYIEEISSIVKYLLTIPFDEQEYRKAINLACFLLNQAQQTIEIIEIKLFEDEVL